MTAPVTPFRPAWWLPGAHAQTLWGKFARRVHVPTRLERWATPDDDFVELHRLDAAEGAPRLVMLHGLEGGVRSGPDAAQLLYQATGWPIPVAAMAAWLQGLPSTPEATQEFGADGRLRRLVADGWTVEYQEWQAADADWPQMPRRLQASREGARVRLAIDGWEAAR